MQQTLQVDVNERIQELEELFAEEKSNEKDKKKLKDLEKAYEDNKESLEKEKVRLEGIILSLSQGVTVSEADYRHLFYKFSNEVQMAS